MAIYGNCWAVVGFVFMSLSLSLPLYYITSPPCLVHMWSVNVGSESDLTVEEAGKTQSYTPKLPALIRRLGFSLCSDDIITPGESVCVCVCDSSIVCKLRKKSPAHACVMSLLAELPYKGVGLCIKDTNMSAPVASLNNSQPVSHEPVVTLAATPAHIVFKVASGAEKNHIQNTERRAGKVHKRFRWTSSTPPAPSLYPHVVENHTTLFKFEPRSRSFRRHQTCQDGVSVSNDAAGMKEIFRVRETCCKFLTKGTLKLRHMFPVFTVFQL